jgi:exodeoxyribonuclease V beta subunit
MAIAKIMMETRASVEHFELGQHAVVEASAGTGKTHTIEQLVRRLLTETAVEFEQILIVTFTEKATGELKNRLRGMLERAIEEDDESTSSLKRALDHFDQASIFTIHGFCQRLLQEYALEQRQDFRAELVHDIDLLKTLLREIQRKHWRAFFGDQLKAVLERALYHRDTAGEWDRRVLEIASKFKPRCGHQLRPVFTPDWYKRLDEADANWAGQLEIFTIHALHEHLREFKRQRGLQSFDDMIARVEESLDASKNSDAAGFLRMLRLRYRYAIVDEFQDTDQLQWLIFRRIFLEGGESKLFVVGDPKQAIFGFRGADLPTYLAAAEQMRASFNASDYPLELNWRSDPRLLDGLNCLFGDGDWFPSESHIRYLEVHAPEKDKRQAHIDADRTKRSPLTIVDLTPWERPKAARKQFARFIAGEIQHLLHGDSAGPMLTLALKGNPPRALRADDICILVVKRTDADPIVQALELAGIPYSFYKQTGLWQSDEAIHLEVLLRCLARPEDRSAFRKALLTCFFRVKPDQLVHAPDIPMAHPARQLYQTWLGYVENREWSALCRSLLEDTGLLFQTGGNGDADRRLATLRYILTTIEQVGHGFNHDLLGLLDWLRERRGQRDTSDADLQPVERGRPKVRIMTIHASKGLEFPIVFLAGGFTQARINPGPMVYRDEEDRIVFDLRPDSDAQERIGAERLSEYRRLLYVALTRPIFKLYVPKIRRRGGQYLGPLGTILLPALERACPDKLGSDVAEVVRPTLAELTPRPAAPTQTIAANLEITPIHIDGPLFPTIDGNLGKRRIVLRSFSSMTRHHLAQVGEGSSFGEQAPPVEDEAATPLDREDPLRGPVFGDMVHKVLEKIDFDEVGRAGSFEELILPGAHARKLIDQEINAKIALLRARIPIDQLKEAARKQIASLVWHALRTPLSAIGGPLANVPEEDRLAEVEFLYPENNEARLEERFVTGFMDLVFRRDKKYYLVDWKTNLLPAYTPEHLARSMAESDYHRQYRLYLQALARWLRGVHGRDNRFVQQCGGVYYLYVRGLNGRDETTGVFFHRPELVASD